MNKVYRKRTKEQDKKSYYSYRRKKDDSFKTWFVFMLFDHVIRKRTSDICTLNNVASYQVSKEVEDLYIHEYWQREMEADVGLTGCTIKEVYKDMKPWLVLKDQDFETKKIIGDLKKLHSEYFESRFNIKDFETLYNKESCAYCGISRTDIKKAIEIKMIYKKHPTRGWPLEIDRLLPNKEYTKENSVRCCYWCNNAKTDEFSGKEFLPIADSIRSVWIERKIIIIDSNKPFSNRWILDQEKLVR